MRFPCSTGEAARLLGVGEPDLGEAVRRRKVAPEPPIVAGRRLWSPSHLLQAAVALERLTDELATRLDSAVSEENTAKQVEEDVK